MANHELESPNVYSELLRKVETTDRVHADVLNPMFKKLINNDAFLEGRVTLARSEDIAASRVADRSLPGIKIKIATDADKIGLTELKQEVKDAMAGTTTVNSTPGDGSVTQSTIATAAVLGEHLSSNALSKISDSYVINEMGSVLAKSKVNLWGLNVDYPVRNGYFEWKDTGDEDLPVNDPNLQILEWEVDLSQETSSSVSYLRSKEIQATADNTGFTWGFWVRKSDLLNLPDDTIEFDWNIFQRDTEGNITNSATTHYSVGDLLDSNFEHVHTTEGITATFKNVVEYGDWIYLQAYVDGIIPDIDHIQTFWRLQEGTGSSVDSYVGTIDLLNNVLVLDEERIYPYRPYMGTEEDLVIVKDTATPLKEPVYKNAVKERFSATENIVSDRFKVANIEDSAKYNFNEDIYNKYGEPNVIKVSGTDGVNTARSGFLIRPEDLEDIGIIPDDTNPPTISTMNCFAKNTLEKFKESSRVWVMLRYGKELELPYDKDHDIGFVDNSGTVSLGFLGDGDAMFNHDNVRINTDLVAGYKHEGIPIPATYNGMQFTGILIQFFGDGLNDDGAPASYELTRNAVVAGDNVYLDQSYKNYPEDFLNEIIKEEDLDKSLQTKINTAAGEVAKKVTLANSDRIGFIGDSYTMSHYTVPDKAYISKLSQLSDYVFENYAVSGQTYPENVKRMRNNTPIYHGSLGWQDYNCKYAVLISYTNDLKYYSFEQYIESLKETIEVVRSLGAEPIISTEYHDNFGPIASMGMKEVAEQYGVMFADILQYCRSFNYDYPPFWGGSHPGTRSNDLFAANLLKYLDTLPRPEKTLKIFRKRDEFNISDRDDLLYDSIPERAEKWKELSVGHYALDNPEYYDALDQNSDNSLVTSEYLKLQNKENVSFGDYALVQATLPATARNIADLNLVLSDPTVTVYARNMFNPPFESTDRYVGFKYEGDPTIVAGDTYTSDDPMLESTVFTVVGQGDGLIICTPNNRDYYNQGSGTLTKASGTGEYNINYSKTDTAFDPTWYENYGKPEGKLVEIVGNEGVYNIPSDEVKNYMKYDKVVFILHKTGGFNLDDVYIEWSGEEGKIYETTKEVKITEGEELLSETKVGTSSELSSWNIEGSITVDQPADGILPYDTDGMVEVTPTDKINQSYTVTGDPERSREVVIKAWARYFPEIYDPNSVEDPIITEDTFDYAKLALDIKANDNDIYTTEKLVGLHWQQIEFTTLLPSRQETQNIKLYSKDLPIQIAKVSVKFKN